MQKASGGVRAPSGRAVIIIVTTISAMTAITLRPTHKRWAASLGLIFESPRTRATFTELRANSVQMPRQELRSSTSKTGEAEMVKKSESRAACEISAPKQLWQISSTFHFPNYSPTSLPIGTSLKINKPRPDTCVNHWTGWQQLAGYGRGKRPPLIQLNKFRIQNLEMQKQTLKNKEGRENNPQNRLLHHHESKVTKQTVILICKLLWL